jgi:uncharacterized iron-regulated membrane protein
MTPLAHDLIHSSRTHMFTRARTIIFWMHLAAGVTAGVVIFIMSVTGALLAFQRQILSVLERNQRWVDVAPGARRLDAGALVHAAAAARPGVQPVSLTLEADPAAAALVAFGQAGNVYVDPYTGAILGVGSAPARAFFRTMTDWHRWLGRNGEGRNSARSITGASNLAFLGLAVTGLFLWWPRQCTAARVRNAMRLDLIARGKARDFNWHTVIGFWCAPVLIILTATGVVISYPWATNLVYRVSGSPSPAASQTPSAPASVPASSASRVAPAVNVPGNLGHLWNRAADQMPGWGSMVMRLPARSGAPVSFTITDAAHWNQFARSQLTLDGKTGDVVRWEPYAATSRGQKVRGWMRFAHTGELGGVFAQAVAGVACVGGAFLVWTGLALALRRVRAWRTAKPRETMRAA